jgi:hypothetical protein
MARYTFGMRGTVVGTNLRAMMSLFAVAGSGGQLREVGIFNTTAVALAIALVRFTAATNVGAGQTEGKYDENTQPPLCTIFAGHTGDGTVGQVLRQATLGAAVGAGIIWTFGDSGIVIPLGTANGLGITVPTGTGQICDLYFDWEE